MGEIADFVNSIKKFIPETWLGDNINIIAYRVYKDANEDIFISKNFVTLKLDILIALVNGILPYVDMQIGLPLQNIPVEIKQEIKHTSKGIYLLFLGHFKNKDEEQNVREKISAALGLIIAIYGRGVGYEKTYDNIIKINLNNISMECQMQVEILKEPDLENIIDKISEVDMNIQNLSEIKKNKAILSLRWFNDATYDEGIDAFLKYWIAMEILTMERETDIKLLKQKICQIYNKSNEDYFEIGRLFGLRGRIIHDGQITSVDEQLLKYMGALYKDILFDYIELPHEYVAEKEMKNDRGFILHEYLKILLKNIRMKLKFHNIPEEKMSDEQIMTNISSFFNQ